MVAGRTGLFLRPSAIDIDRPDHPALVGEGCKEQMRTSLLYGVLIGGGVAMLFGGSKAIKYGLGSRDLITTLTRNICYIGVPIGGTFAGAAWLRC